MGVTHMLIETGRASRSSACDEPFANGQQGSEDLDDVTCPACRAAMTADHTVAEDGYQERDDCAEAVEAARAEGDEAVRIWHSQYSRVRAECDALRARIEALARGWDYRSCPCGLELDAALAGDDK